MVAKSIATIYTNIHKPTDYSTKYRNRHVVTGFSFILFLVDRGNFG